MDDVHITKWKQLEPTAAHLTYLLLPGFLITYALFTEFIRNRLHLSEPPLAVLFGIIFGKHGLHVITPREWGFHDAVMQEVTRIIVGVQCFTVSQKSLRLTILISPRSALNCPNTTLSVIGKVLL